MVSKDEVSNIRGTTLLSYQSCDRYLCPDSIHMRRYRVLDLFSLCLIRFSFRHAYFTCSLSGGIPDSNASSDIVLSLQEVVNTVYIYWIGQENPKQVPEVCSIVQSDASTPVRIRSSMPTTKRITITLSNMLPALLGILFQYASFQMRYGM